MGAKQSKRSVDISGKEAEGGEVAAAGAGGEGRVEQLADADTLKAQLNGDAHIHEQTDKEKQLEIGTPENEKDATTEKEAKEQAVESDKEKDSAPVTNGDSEPKPENGEASPAPEDGKKPKKEKVKKKWSLRSISFSRKDKPKQEKKQKEDEPKTNGEPEKVPEEAAEVTTETAAEEVATEVKPETEVKEEHTPDTPVTEPLTNGSSTPDAAAPVDPPQPDDLPLNGLSLEEPKSEAPIVPQKEESKPEEPIAETTETAPAPEIPVIKEVCVERLPLEPMPPPLPANPPPSSVASFAATTMAPEITDASLANTAALATAAPLSAIGTDLTPTLTNTETVNITEIVATELPPPLKEIVDEKPVEVKSEPVVEIVPDVAEIFEQAIVENVEKPTVENIEKSIVENIEQPIVENVEQPVVENSEQPIVGNIDEQSAIKNIEHSVEIVSEIPAPVNNIPIPESNLDIPDLLQQDLIEAKQEHLEVKGEKISSMVVEENKDVKVPENIPEVQEALVPNDIEDLPPPPPLEDDAPAKIDINTKLGELEIETQDTILNSNHISDMNGVNTETLNGNVVTEQENLKNKTKDALGNVPASIECNGNVEPAGVTKQESTEESIKTTTSSELSMPTSPSAEAAGEDASDAFPPPPGDLAAQDPPQEPLPVSDKLADLIPEVPVVPELNTEMLQETTSDVVVAN